MAGRSIVKVIFLIVFFIFCVMNAAAQNVNVTIQITNVVVNNGPIIGAIFYTAEAYRKEEHSVAFKIEANAPTVSHAISVPPGEYVIVVFQDTNNNEQLDRRGLFPTELLGMSNFNGSGLPTQNFNRQKIPVNSSTPVITIGLYRLR